MARYQEQLTRATAEDVTVDGDGAQPTSRRLPDNDDRIEWRESGKIDGVPVGIYYMTEPGADEDNIDWLGSVDRIELDLCGCDRLGVTDEAISAVVARLGSALSWRDLIVTDDEGNALGTLAEVVGRADASLSGIEVSPFGGVQYWLGHMLSREDEDADWDTPCCEVDWTGFAEAFQAARH